MTVKIFICIFYLNFYVTIGLNMYVYSLDTLYTYIHTLFLVQLFFYFREKACFLLSYECRVNETRRNFHDARAVGKQLLIFDAKHDTFEYKMLLTLFLSKFNLRYILKIL